MVVGEKDTEVTKGPITADIMVEKEADIGQEQDQEKGEEKFGTQVCLGSI